MSETTETGSPKLRHMNVVDRRTYLAAQCGLSVADLDILQSGGMTLEKASCLSDNVVGVHTLPIGLATNFVINGSRVDYVPMCIEEASVVASASRGAKCFAAGGGFTACATDPVMTVQVCLLGVKGVFRKIQTEIVRAQPKIKELVNATMLNMVKRGGGFSGVEVHQARSYRSGASKQRFVIVETHVNVCDAMGANIVNTVGETLKPFLSKLLGASSVLMSILTNLPLRRKVQVSGVVPLEMLRTATMSGEEVRDRIVLAGAFADAYTFRAATHNKGIMNGIDAVALATGQDWRAIEAGAHGYAALGGHYQSLSEWSVCSATGNLQGNLVLPLAVGTVGACITAQPSAVVALKVLGNPDARTLAEIMGSVGLAQNFSALHALVTDGIQKGFGKHYERQQALVASR